MQPYAELLEFNQPNPVRKEGFTRIRDSFPGLKDIVTVEGNDAVSGRSGNVYPFNPERIMEFAGRWDYGLNNARKLGEEVKVVKSQTVDGIEYDRVPIIVKYISMGHESMIEMGDATFFLECSRPVANEIVRHRIASYQQESQRFVKYDDEDPEDEDLFYNPGDDTEIMSEVMGYGPYTTKEFFKDVYFAGMQAYKDLRADGVPPQIARYALPNAMRTRLIMKTNAREWRHILKLRTDRSAQPEMRELMLQVHDQLVDIFPNAMKGVLDGERGVR